jgi:hypothetical protein
MDHDYERMQITGGPDSEEKISAITVLNRLFKSDEYRLSIQPLSYDDVTVFVEIYFNKGNKTPILEKLTALKSKTAYKDAVEDYFLSGFDKSQLYDSLDNLRERFSKNGIETENDLLEVVLEALNGSLKHHVENRRWIDAFWDGARKVKYQGEDIIVPRQPKSETRIQPTLHVVLDIGLSPLGIQVIRESDEGIGSLDFRFLYTNKNGEALSVALEFKLAHHKKIKKGLISQLPAYLKAMNSRSGILSILWFKDEKGKIFREPRQYQFHEMKSWLEEQVVLVNEKNDIHIAVSMIDASIKSSASNI